jgi:predicted transcriptional regulator
MTMTQPKLSALELRIMNELWTRGPCAIREIHEAVVKKDRPAYTTVQTMVYRLEAKKALRRARKIGNAHIFEAVISRDAAQRRLVDEFLSIFGGKMQPVMAQLIEAGNLTSKDVTDAEKLLQELAAKRKKEA